MNFPKMETSDPGARDGTNDAAFTPEPVVMTGLLLGNHGDTLHISGRPGKAVQHGEYEAAQTVQVHALRECIVHLVQELRPR